LKIQRRQVEPREPDPRKLGGGRNKKKNFFEIRSTSIIVDGSDEEKRFPCSLRDARSEKEKEYPLCRRAETEPTEGRKKIARVPPNR